MQSEEERLNIKPGKHTIMRQSSFECKLKAEPGVVSSDLMCSKQGKNERHLTHSPQ